MSNIRVTALYKFVAFDDPEALREPLFEALSALGIKGTILLASEGVNGTIAGSHEAMDEALDALRTKDVRSTSMERLRVTWAAAARPSAVSL